MVSTRLLFWAHLFFSFLQLPTCFSLSIPLNPNPNSPVFTGLGLTLKLSSYNVDFWFFSLILGWFCTNFVSLHRKKMLIFVTLMFPAQLYWGYWSDFEILLPLFNFSLFMEAPKLFLCAELCFHPQWRKNNLGWGKLGAQLFSLIHEGSTGQMVRGIFRSCQDHPALRRHGRRDSPKKKKKKLFNTGLLKKPKEFGPLLCGDYGSVNEEGKEKQGMNNERAPGIL